VTVLHNHRPAHLTQGKDTPTLTHHQQHNHPSPDAPDAPQQPKHPPHTTPATNESPEPATQRLTAYIRCIVDTAPTPTPAQLERLAGLLRDLRNPSESS